MGSLCDSVIVCGAKRQHRYRLCTAEVRASNSLHSMFYEYGLCQCRAGSVNRRAKIRPVAGSSSLSPLAYERAEDILVVRLACMGASDAASTDFRHHLTLI
jgi:hypothetical protein